MPQERQLPTTEFGQKLFRKYRADNLAELSEKSGIPRSTLRGYLNPDYVSRAYSTLRRDAALLGLTPGQFLDSLLTDKETA